MASDLRALLAVVAEFLPVEGVPEMVVYDNLYGQADFGTIDEPLRQILLARRGTIEADHGTIVRRLGSSGITLTSDGRILWHKDEVICRGGDLPATEGPGHRSWLADTPGPVAIGRPGALYRKGTYYVRPNGLPSYVDNGQLVWPYGSVPYSVDLNGGLRFNVPFHRATPLSPEELERYRLMEQQCLADE
jgi:hypothetical protein